MPNLTRALKCRLTFTDSLRCLSASYAFVCQLLPAPGAIVSPSQPQYTQHLQIALSLALVSAYLTNVHKVLLASTSHILVKDKANRHELKDADSWSKLKSSVGSKIFKRSETSGASSDQYSSGKQNPSIGGPYSSIDNKKTSTRPPFAYVNGPRTVVVGGRQGDIDDDDIHLTYEMEMTVQDKKRIISNV